MIVDSEESDEKQKVGKYFIAVEVPESIKQTIYNKVKNILDRKELSLLKQDKYHITLFYIGFVPKEKAFSFFYRLPDIAPFRIELSGIGYFNTHVIWLGINDAEKKLKEINWKFEQSDYKPHITLARNKDLPKESYQRIITRLRELKIKHDFIAKEIILFESIPCLEGHFYKRVATKPLC